MNDSLFATSDENGQQFVMLNMEGGQEASGGQYVMDSEGNIHYIMMEEGENQTSQEDSAAATTEGEFFLDEAMAEAALANGGQIEINGVLYQLQTSSDDPNTMMIDMSALPTTTEPLFSSQANDTVLTSLEKRTDKNLISKSDEITAAELPELNESNISPKVDAEGHMLTDKETTDLSEFLDIKSTLSETTATNDINKHTDEVINEDDDDDSPEFIKYIQVPSGKDGQPINIQISTNKSNLSHKVVILPMNSNEPNGKTSVTNTSTTQTLPKFNVISKSQLLANESNKSQENKDVLHAKGKMITFDRLKSEYKFYPKTKKGNLPLEQKSSKKVMDEDSEEEEFYEKNTKIKPIQGQNLKGKGSNFRALPKGSKIIMSSNKVNKSLMCRPTMATKATSCNPIKVAKVTQTDLSDEEEKICIPVPFPMCVPAPVFEGTVPVPFPIPIALPIPVPLYTPMSKEAVSIALIKLKELYESLPSDEESNMEQQQETTVAILTKIAASEGFDEINLSQETEVKKVAAVTLSLKSDSNLDADIQTIDALIGEELEKGENIENENQDTGNNAISKIADNIQPFFEKINFFIAPTNVRRVPINCAGMNLKYNYGINAWRQWVTAKNSQLTEQNILIRSIPRDPLHCAPHQLSEYLSSFIKEIIKPTGEPYANDSIYYFCLGIQHYLFENGRFDNIFYDSSYKKFISTLHETLNDYQVKINDKGLIVCRVREEYLWESRQLGVHSPHVLLNTLLYFNTKHYMLTTVEDHKAISFANVMKQWKKMGTSPILGRPPQRSVYLKYSQTNVNQKNHLEYPCEQFENPENPHRCPVKIYEFYLLKCPESIKNRYDVFYMVPEPSCIPESPVWFSAQPLSHHQLEVMLTRVKVIKEILEIQINNLPPTITYA